MAVARTISSNVLESIGNTPLVALRRVVPAGGARILVKVEGANPTGSMKDRMAAKVVERAEADGRLPAGGTVVEYTGGSTGTSLALVCAAKGYRIRLVTSDAFSQEKRDHMRALGAEVIEIPSDRLRITRELTEAMIERARHLSEEPGCFFCDQLRNPDAIDGYRSLGDEIWTQSGGSVDTFVQAVGTSQSIQGAAKVLRPYGVRVVAVEPAESAVISGGPSGGHRIEGIGPGFVPPLWHDGAADEILPVSSDEAERMARRLAAEEGLFAGTSSGANVVAALRLAERLGAGHTLVTVLIDSGLKYLTTSLYSSRTPQGHGEPASHPDRSEQP